MWQMFAQIAVAKEYEVDPKEYFVSYANLAFSMSKVEFEGQTFW